MKSDIDIQLLKDALRLYKQVVQETPGGLASLGRLALRNPGLMDRLMAAEGAPTPLVVAFEKSYYAAKESPGVGGPTYYVRHPDESYSVADPQPEHNSVRATTRQLVAALREYGSFPPDVLPALQAAERAIDSGTCFAGHALVPVEPTSAMLAVHAPEDERPGDVGTMKYRRGIWRAMLSVCGVPAMVRMGPQAYCGRCDRSPAQAPDCPHGARCGRPDVASDNP